VCDAVPILAAINGGSRDNSCCKHRTFVGDISFYEHPASQWESPISIRLVQLGKNQQGVIMLAARDQENLAHGHQNGAASKPLNQGTKQLAPKTPGNKASKTPFKLPLNDENAPPGFGGGKTGLKVNGRGNDNLIIGGKKNAALDRNAFVTPMGTAHRPPRDAKSLTLTGSATGPRNRAPLGLKTTNARAKALQIPAAPAADDDLDKANQKSGTARRPKPRVSHAEMTKVGVLGEMDDLEGREIEYMPPRPKGKPRHSTLYMILNADSLKPYLITLTIGHTTWTILDSKGAA